MKKIVGLAVVLAMVLSILPLAAFAVPGVIDISVGYSEYIDLYAEDQLTLKVDATEKDVLYFTNKRSLPVIKSLCPEDHATERENMKKLLHELERDNKGLRHRIFGAMCKGEIDGFKLCGRYPDAGKLEE